MVRLVPVYEPSCGVVKANSGGVRSTVMFATGTGVESFALSVTVAVMMAVPSFDSRLLMSTFHFIRVGSSAFSRSTALASSSSSALRVTFSLFWSLVNTISSIPDEPFIFPALSDTVPMISTFTSGFSSPLSAFFITFV